MGSLHNVMSNMRLCVCSCYGTGRASGIMHLTTIVQVHSTCELSFSGPDICGPGTKKVHVIFTYNGKNLLIKKDIRCKDDQFTHLYTLVLRPDNTYEVLIDSESAQKGTLEEDWDFLPPKMINDPEAKKPEDWDDNPKIDDPEDVKPEVCVFV